MVLPPREPDEESTTTKHQKLGETVRVSNILELPSEILKSIILHLNARERVSLAKACRNFHTFIFEDAELLRDLDFSQNVHLTSATDIQEYFENANTHKYLQRLNIRHVKCIKTGFLLDHLIGKALNLVDVNMHGIILKDIWQLGRFMNPLLHLQKLSFDWPETRKSNIPLCYKVLRGPFSRLNYLSVELKVVDALKVLIPYLMLCQELQKLRVVVNADSGTEFIHTWEKEPDKLKNLKIIEYCGPSADQLKDCFIPLLVDLQHWADFRFEKSHTNKGFYLENITFCDELRDAYRIEYLARSTPEDRSKLGFALIPELLLTVVLRINHLDVPAEFCCLSTYREGKRCLLKINDAKFFAVSKSRETIIIATYIHTNFDLFIEDVASGHYNAHCSELQWFAPDKESKMSNFLYINYPAEIGCDVHLVASAFPNLTELVLSGITRDLDSVPKTHFERRLKARTSTIVDEHEESLNMDSSFKMLVENTPHLKHFTLDGRTGCQNWDLDALYEMSGWKKLETLCLRLIPIEDGHFLIEIGKRCKNLKKLELMDLGTIASRYERELFHMLKHCRSLTDFSIDDKAFDITELLEALVSNARLERVCAKSKSHDLCRDSFSSAMEELLRQCSKLTILRCECEVRKGKAHFGEPINVNRLKPRRNS